MEDAFRLDGKQALVTGGSKGIGLAIAEAFARAGADVALVARTQGDLDAARTRLLTTGRQVRVFALDLAEVERIPSLFDSIVAETGGIDILVNNAGGTRRGPAQDVEPRDWDFVLDLNVSAVFRLSQAFARERIRSKRPGKIINTASLMSEAVREDNAPYAASKGAIRQLTKALAVDWARYGIHVNAIGPGYIRTELTRPLWEDDAFSRWVKERAPLGRWGRPEDVAQAAVFLASPASDFITGQILYVDGGWLSRF
jgi:NAD(P)-dependent dehydrogenase (short-subunit alcohol dehydrogenase family)